MLLGCDTCKRTTSHTPAYRVVGKLDKAELDGAFRLRRMQDIEPTKERLANAIEILYVCVECGELRRWGLEVNDGQAGRVRSGAKQPGEQGGEGDGEGVGREPGVPEGEVAAAHERMGKGTGVGGA